jgi:hypothetical protein
MWLRIADPARVRRSRLADSVGWLFSGQAVTSG